MIWIDWFLLAIIAVSALLSLWRGFVREALSLAGWVVALWVAMLFFHDFGNWLADWISSPTIRNVVAFTLLFAAVVLLAGVVNYLAGQLIDKTGLTGTDRALGIVFGVARGIVIVAILVLLAGLTPLPQESWWHESLLLVQFQDMALWLRSFLPADIADNIRY
ncbi:MAG TPA: CvpA family protein [Gammaproteobacteria bacterium]|nr:CvpA family protein [Gammaproteobacteria bacterium]